MRTSIALGSVIAATSVFVAVALASPPRYVVRSWSTGTRAPEVMVSGSKGTLWFTEIPNRIAKITTAGAITEYRVPGQPLALARTRDGNLWFSVVGKNAIYRMTPRGTTTAYALGSTRGHGPYQIAAGRNGTVWFTDPFSNAVGFVAPSGRVREFPIGGSGTVARFPQGITLGPDGNMWFTLENAPAAIGRITPSGVVTIFRDNLSPGGNPSHITSGPDGNLWFSEYTGNAIGRITPTGEIDEYILPGGSFPGPLISAPDGKIWFALDGSFYGGNIDGIGRIDPSTGAVTVTKLRLRSAPQGIAIGSDGNVWFTEPQLRQIGMISLR